MTCLEVPVHLPAGIELALFARRELPSKSHGTSTSLGKGSQSARHAFALIDHDVVVSFAAGVTADEEGRYQCLWLGLEDLGDSRARKGNDRGITCARSDELVDGADIAIGDRDADELVVVLGQPARCAELETLNEPVQRSVMGP